MNNRADHRCNPRLSERHNLRAGDNSLESFPESFLEADIDHEGRCSVLICRRHTADLVIA